MRSLISIRGLNMIFITVRGERIHALADINVGVDEGEFVTVVGPSGCGKTTLLRILGGLLRRTSGHVTLAGAPVDGPRRDIGIVFQNPILLPWRTVLENALLPAEVLGLSKLEYRPRALELLKMVGLEGFDDKYPMELSGGMQQRAAITRALLHDPAILLMDEPFGALDAMTREQMNLELQSIWQASRKTILLITHSIPEAVFLGDRILVMTPRPGKLAKILTVDIPRPRSLDVMATPRFGEFTREIRALFAQKGSID
jgi:NitT/TauT family transport system ATP-binding protein